MPNLFQKIFLLLLAGLLAASSVAASNDLQTSQLSIKVVDNRVTLHLNKADIREVLNKLAEQGGFTLTLDDNIKGRVTLDLQNVTIEQAVQSLTDNLALQFTFDPRNKTYKIINAASFASRETTHAQGEKGAAPTKKPVEKQPVTNIPATAPPKIKTETPKPAEVARDSHGRPLYKPGELLITFNNKATDEQIQALHTRLGSTVLKRLPYRRLHHIRLRAGLSESAAIKIYQDSGLVNMAGRNTIRYPSSTVPDDPFYNLQWNMDIIQAPQAWDFTRGSAETIVAIIDTGVTYDHPDLTANIWTNLVELNGTIGVDDDENGYVDDMHGWDFADNDNDPSDPDGHGTHVAGVIGAAGNNGTGIAGINWYVSIMVLKVMQDNDFGFTTAAIIEAMDYAGRMGAEIINCSYGGSLYDATEYQAMDDLRSAGILAACTAGNDGIDIDAQKEYPATFDLDNIIAVAASSATDGLASFSNYGVVNVDLAAPGESIFSTIAGITTQAMVRLNSNPPLEYTARGLEFAGTTDDAGLTGNLVNCGIGDTTDFPQEVAGNIAFIERGDLYFAKKVTNAQAAGAIGAIIYDNVVDTVPFNGTLQTSGSWIPAIAITKAAGEDLLGRIDTNPSVTLVNKLVADPSYHYLSGTSMAAPHVAGAAALLYGLNPNLNYQEVRDIILNSVDPIPAADGKTVTGGRLNVFKAIQQAFPGGDVNGDNIVNLADAILILQFLSYQDVEFCPNCRELGADINGDGLTRQEEVIYILQKISGMR